MMILPSRKQWVRWSVPSKMTFIASLTSVLGLIFSLFSLFYMPGSAPTGIHEKIKDLDKIQIALGTLNNYVQNQQKSLKEISKEKTNLESEKNRIQKALKIDKENLDALLEYQIVQQKKDIWLELFASFLVGVLSSSIVTFLAIRYQDRRKVKANDE